MSKLVDEFLGQLNDADSDQQRITTTIEGEALRIVQKWRGQRMCREWCLWEGRTCRGSDSQG